MTKETKETINNNRLAMIKFNLQQKGYLAWESRLESDGIYIMFDKVYEFNNIPDDFEILDTMICHCEHCHYAINCPDTPCNNYSGLYTFLVHKERNPFNSEEELEGIIETLRVWERELPDRYKNHATQGKKRKNKAKSLK